MPLLTWNSKSTPSVPDGALETEAIIYPAGEGYPAAAPQDRLMLGENLAVMAALLPEYAGRVDLIYADPPFFTQRRYPARIGRGEDSRRPEQWQLSEGYPDSWPNLDAYLDMLYPRLQLMHRLLAPTGTLYLHLDWHADAYARVLLDEIFGPDRLLNQIIWTYHGPSPIRSAFNRKHDTILSYTKSADYTFNADAVREPYNPSTVKTFASSSKAGFGKVPNLKRGKVPEDWWYFPVVARLHNERTGYPTQKPEALLERIILGSSNPGDLVADFFSGSGTTAAVATRHGRRYLASDVAWRAVHTTRARLVREGAPAFSLELETSRPIERSPLQDYPGATRRAEAISLADSAADELDYWEIDPAWDGKIFRSAAQAMRPLRKSELPTQLPLPEVDSAGPACVRLVSASGERFQAVLPPSD